VQPRAGIHSVGIGAVDVDGQVADSELLFYVVPTTAVETEDIRLQRTDVGLQLRFRTATAEARWQAWTRSLRGRAGDAASEWASGEYTLAASIAPTTAGEIVLEWTVPVGGTTAVLLRGEDEDGVRLFGPFVDRAAAASSRLLAPIPNPFNPGTTLAFVLANAGSVTLEICTVDGRHVRRLHAGRLQAGTHRLAWDGRDDAGRGVASGVYVALLRAFGITSTQRLVLLR
jgi:hypothetical protein